jgi:hypothetical protein
MNPPIFQVCAADLAVTALLGTGPTRLFPFGEAPRGVTLPYATWQTIGGLPENYLAGAPDLDSFSLQIDIYASTATEARNAAKALRDAIEPVAYVTRWGGESRDPQTRHYRYSFDVDWHVQR